MQEELDSDTYSHIPDGYALYQNIFRQILARREERRRLPWSQRPEQLGFTDFPPHGEEIMVLRDNILKSQAIEALVTGYFALSREAKAALTAYTPGFERDITTCRRGDLCNFLTANVIRRTYNAIAPSKGLEQMERNMSNLDPIGGVDH